MKLFVSLLIAVCLSACASTRLYDPRSGKLIASMQLNGKGVKYRAGDTTFDAEIVNHSTPTNSFWRGFNNGLKTAISGGVAVFAPGSSGTATTAVRVLGGSVPHLNNVTPPKGRSAEEIWPIP